MTEAHMKTKFLVFALALSLGSIAAWASPAESRLLPMVPEDAQIVSGMKLTLESEARDRQSLVVHNNNLDFNDWLALVSVDPQVSGRELLQAAASSPRGELAERLLLVDGTFDAEHIYRAAMVGGASEAQFAGVRVIIVLPFAREKSARLGVRWLAIPDDRTALFGTPLLVQEALHRRAAHAETNAVLAGHLKELPAGVDDWTVVAMPPEMFERHLGNTSYAAEAIQALTRSDDLVMGFRYARSRATIDFVAHASRDLSQEMFASDQAQLLAARLNRNSRVHLERITVQGLRVSGSLTITGTKWANTARELANR
jgi:hypothetical protein